MHLIKLKLHSSFTNGCTRSITVKKNIAGALVLKCISILISLQVVPLTIDYINPTKYGIWLTLSSIIAWLSYFDLGFAHGFRNRFAESKAKGDIKLAKEYISTTYIVLFLLFSFILLIVLIVNNFLNWSSILNIAPVYNKELHIVFGLLACFFCLNIVADRGAGFCFSWCLYFDENNFWKFKCFSCSFCRNSLCAVDYIFYNNV